ncbi:MAG: esterase family protein [Chloroflexi bacterium]|nr:esterase family protein [Chloroflexota bacterium]
MALHKLVKRARAEGTPLIDGQQLTFVWQGQRAPYLLGDFNQWGYGMPPTELQAVGRGVWAHTVSLPAPAYLEYIYTDDLEGGERVPDPFNTHKASNGLGKFNYYVRMPGYQHSRLLRPKAGIARGTLTKHLLESDYLLVGGQRDLWLYQPPTPDPVPLLLVYDGNDYLRRAKLINIIDNLIAQGRIRPLALALIALSSVKGARFIEYVANEATVALAGQHILTLARQHLNLLDVNQYPGAYGTLGASMGGLMALYTALRLPNIYRHVMSQSGAFNFLIMPQTPLINFVVDHYDGPPLRIWLDCGQYEWLIHTNREMLPRLLAKGHHVIYREYAGGHNYTCWRDELAHGLETLFPLE